MQTPYARPSNLLLWFSILAAPSAWSAHLSIEYFLVTVDCELSGGNMGPWMAVSTVALYALTFSGLFAGFVARKSAQQHPEPDSKEGKRRLFMADCGIALSVLFLAGLAMATIPMVFLEPCLAGP